VTVPFPAPFPAVVNRLLRAIGLHIGEIADLRVQSAAWASATFIGMRHVIWFDVPITDAVDHFVRGLRDVDLPMPGHIVADIDLIERHDRDGTARIGLGVLTIEAV
jgi:hypothetical protein